MLKVGMFTSGYQRNPLEHCFMDAKEYGYDYIELWGGRPHAYAPDLKAGDINEVRRLIEKYEMPVLGYTPEHNAYPYNYMIGSEAQRRDAVDYLKLSLEMAKEMGAEFVLTSPANGGYLATYDQLWSRLEKNIQELGDYAAQLTSRIQHTNSFNEFSLRNTPAIITHADTEIFFNNNLNLFTRLHFKFIDTVIDNFFQKNVDTVLGM